MIVLALLTYYCVKTSMIWKMLIVLILKITKRRGAYSLFVILVAAIIREGGAFFEIQDFRFLVFAYSVDLIDS